MLKKFCCCLLISFLTLTTTHAQAKANFGNGLVLLNPPGDGLFFEGKLSPDGQFAAGARVSDMAIYEGTHLYLWDLRDVNRDDVGTQPAPLASFDLSPYAGSNFDQGHIAFSPDSRKLAIFTLQAVLVLNIPEFELIETVPIDGLNQSWGSINWSSDGHLLAVSHEKGLTVWDGANTYTTDQEIGWTGKVTYFVDGWLIDYETTFSFCTTLLESCSESYTGRLQIVRESDQLLITDDTDAPTLVWTRDFDGIFQADSTRYADVEGTLSSFSPDGQYSLIMRWTEGGNPDYPYYVLYEGQTALYELNSHNQPLWLGTSGYFVQGNNLYHPTSTEPVDTLDSFHIEGITDDAQLGLWPEYLGGESLSDDGRWFMRILGTTALIVPVNLD